MCSSTKHTTSLLKYLINRKLVLDRLRAIGFRLQAEQQPALWLRAMSWVKSIGTVLTTSRLVRTYRSTSCYYIKPLVSPIGNGKFRPPASQETFIRFWRNLKRRTTLYLPKTTQHARPHISASAWVVWANTQFATVSFFPCLSFFLSFFLLISSSRTQVAPMDRSVLK